MPAVFPHNPFLQPDKGQLLSPDRDFSFPAKSDTHRCAEEEKKIPTEYRSALNKAESYSEMLHMSKADIYDQLVSEYGEQFTEEAAQYAIDYLE